MPATKEAARPTLARATGPRKTNPSLSYHPRSVGASLQYLPPCDLDAEVAVLAALLDREYKHHVKAALPPWGGERLFAHRSHGIAFDSIVRGERVNLAAPEWDKLLACCTFANHGYWTRRLLTAAKLRRCALAADCLARAAQAGDLEGVKRIVRGLVQVLEEVPCVN